MKNGPGIIWLKMATIYFVVGISLGLYMGATGDHTLRPVHAHLNLLGWASMALIGLIYRQFPGLADTTFAKIQFWAHNLGLPVLMVLLALFLSGNAALQPVVGVASAIVGLSVVLFAVNLFKNMRGSVD